MVSKFSTFEVLYSFGNTLIAGCNIRCLWFPNFADILICKCKHVLVFLVDWTTRCVCWAKDLQSIKPTLIVETFRILAPNQRKACLPMTSNKAYDFHIGNCFFLLKVIDAATYEHTAQDNRQNIAYRELHARCSLSVSTPLFFFSLCSICFFVVSKVAWLSSLWQFVWLCCPSCLLFLAWKFTW